MLGSQGRFTPRALEAAMDADILDREAGAHHDGGAKRRQIMDGARTVFLSAGFDGASMNDIARAAGVSKGTLYAYFASKDDLFEAIIRGEFAQAAERLCTFQARGRRPRDADRLRRPADRADGRARNAGAGARRRRGGRKNSRRSAAPFTRPARSSARPDSPASSPRWRPRARSRSPTPSAPPGISSTFARAMSTSASCLAWSTA